MNELREWVRDDFGVSLDRVEEIHHGADLAARLWRGVATDGSLYAVKLTGADSTAGLVVASKLAGRGVAGVPAPVITRDGRLWSGRDGRHLTLVPWVSDRRAYGGPMTAEHWRSYGTLLAALHATPTSSLVGTVPAHDDGRAVSLIRSLNGRLSGPVDGDALIRDLAGEWQAASASIAELVVAVARLAPSAGGSVLCHADPHLHNLLLGPAGAVWLVDWDDAVLASPELDLMFVLVGVLDEPVSAEQQEWFFAGYGPAEIDPARLAYYRSVRALEDLDFAQQVLDPGLAVEERSWALSIVRGVLSPAGLVPLALASVRELGVGSGDSGTSHVRRAG